MEKVSLENFKKVVVDSNIKVILISSPTNYLSYEKSEEVSYLKYEINHQVLAISKTSSLGEEKVLTVYVYYDSFDELLVNGNSIVIGLSIIRQDQFTIYATGNASVDLRLELGHLYASTHGNSRITARGKVTNEKIEVEGVSLFRAEDLIAQTVILNVRGSGQVYIWSDREIKGRAAAGTAIYYRGEPARIRINSNVTFTSSDLPFLLVKLD